MKIFLTILAYVGLALVLFTAILMFWITIDLITAPATFWEEPWPHHSFAALAIVLKRLTPLIFLEFSLIAVFGVILTLVGGTAVRPRYLWISLITVGALYGLSSSGSIYYIYIEYTHPSSYVHWNRTLLWVLSLIPLAPGLVCIVEGILIRRPKKKLQKPA